MHIQKNEVEEEADEKIAPKLSNLSPTPQKVSPNIKKKKKRKKNEDSQTNKQTDRQAEKNTIIGLLRLL